MIISFIRGIKDGLLHARGKPLKYNNLYDLQIDAPDTDQQTQYTIDQLESEVLMIETIIKRDNERAALLEKALTKASYKQRETILNKLNALDKQTFRHRKKIERLQDRINELKI